MTVYFEKRRQRWVFDFERNGARHYGYCTNALGEPVKSRSAAMQAEGVEKRRIEMEPKAARPGEMTFALAMAALTPVWATQACWSNRQRCLKELIAFFGIDTAIGAIDQAKVDDYVSRTRTAKIMEWLGGPTRDPVDDRNGRFWRPTERVRAPATSNLYLGTLRQIFTRAAAHRDPTTGQPIFAWLPTVPELARPKRKARPMPDQVAAEIMSIMPNHVVDAMMLTALFGFRRGEVFTLKRSHIDWDGSGIRLLAEDVKDAEDIFLPASQFAMGYLRSLDIEAETRGTQNLVSWQRKDGEAFTAIAKSRGAWRRARKMMLEKYGRTWRWHDLRGAFITHVAMTSGGMVAQALARHSDPQTTQGYIEVADEMRRLAADRISGHVLLMAANESPRQDSQTQQFAAMQGRRKPLI